jgi:uncharacterized protein (DUF4415 family)
MSENTTTLKYDDVPYDPNNEDSVKAFWDGATVRKGRGKQKQPTKSQVTIRLSPDVLEYFKGDGAGWQTRIDAVLKDYISLH